MSSPDGMAGVFDRAADVYDAVGVPWFGPIAQGLVEALAVRPGERVLDLGCGRGAALLPMARATGPGGHALGLDLAPRMVALTAADVADLPWVEVRVGDAAAPDVPPGSYDVVACCLVLFFLPDPAAAVRAQAAALVPGGRLGITTFSAQPDPWPELEAVFAPYAAGEGAPVPLDVEPMLAGAGLVDVRATHRTVGARFADPQQWVDFSWSHGQRAVWERVPEDARDAVREQALAVLAGRDDLTLTAQVRHTVGRRPGGDAGRSG